MVEVFKGNRSDEHDNNAPFHPKVSIGVQTTLSTSSKGREVYHARGKTHTNWRGGGMLSLPLFATHTSSSYCYSSCSLLG